MIGQVHVAMLSAFPSRLRSCIDVLLVLALALLLAACSGAGNDAPPAAEATATAADSGGAVSVAEPPVPMTPKDVLAGTVWPEAALGDGQASLSCSIDYEDAGASSSGASSAGQSAAGERGSDQRHAGEGNPGEDSAGESRMLAGLDYFQVLDAMEPCRDSGVVRLHYKGKIDAGFVDLMQRVTAMAERMGIRGRILDIDSAGGHIEQGIRAGDDIGNSGWTLWVREGAVCHSACVLILAAGDNRLVSGDVGIHRMLRIGSKAATRAELNAELRDVHQQLSEYLQRHGAAVAVADLMMTVPSRDLRLLSEAELRLYGLDGANAVQQDLERVVLLRECGEDFVRRREGFMRSFQEQCASGDAAIGDKNDCARELLPRFGFPDKSCPGHAPMLEIGPAQGQAGLSLWGTVR